jgi:hypothetical protein
LSVIPLIWNVGELLALSHELDDRERGDDTAQGALELLGGELFDGLVLRGEALGGTAHVQRVGADLHDRDAVDVQSHAVERLGLGVQRHLARTQRDDLVALRDRVDQRLAVDDDGHGGVDDLGAARAVGVDDRSLHLLLAARDDERLVGSGDLDPAAGEQQHDQTDHDQDDDRDADEYQNADESGDLHLTTPCVTRSE